MKRLALIALLALAAPSYGQCVNGSCLPAKEVARVAAQADDKYEWIKQNEDQYILHRNGIVYGQWYVPDGQFYIKDQGRYIGPYKPPIDPPGRSTFSDEARHWSQNGISSNYLGRDRLAYGGKVIHPNQLHAAFDGKLEDDSAKGNFVIIAKDQTVRDRVFADWQKLPTEFTTRYNVWMAPPDHFSMQDRFANKPRFYSEGDPTIVLQDKEGVVLFRRPQANQHYASSDMQDLLKADPNYNPKLDPGGPAPTLGFTLTPPIFACLTLVAIFGIMLLIKFLRTRFSKR